MANPILPGLPPAEQALLYSKLNAYNEGRSSFKEVGAYLVVLPHDGHPNYSLRIFMPLPDRTVAYFLCQLSPNIHEALRIASSLCYYSPRRIYVVEYNAKRMQSRGDDIIFFGKYRGHYLHEILSIDPAYLGWIAYKFEPRIPKHERFVEIARIYHSVHLDVLRRKREMNRPAPQYLGNEGERVTDLWLTVTGVRLEDDPYKTKVSGGTAHFYVRQLLKLKDDHGNVVAMRLLSRTASLASCTLPASEHAFRTGERVKVESARIARTYMQGNQPVTRLSHAKIAY